MKTFSDNTGRTWSVSITIDTIKRVRLLAGVDLLQAVGGRLLETLTTDPVLLCDVLFAICHAEAEARNISDADFGRALAGDAIDAATTALLEELVDFFPQARRRVLAKAMAKLRTLQARALEMAEARLDSADLDAAMEQALAGSLHAQEASRRGIAHQTQEPAPIAIPPARAPGSGLSSGNSPASSGSIPVV